MANSRRSLVGIVLAYWAIGLDSTSRSDIFNKNGDLHLAASWQEL